MNGIELCDKKPIVEKAYIILATIENGTVFEKTSYFLGYWNVDLQTFTNDNNECIFSKIFYWYENIDSENTK